MDKGGSCWQISFAKQETYSDAMNNFMEAYFDVTSCNYTQDNQEQLVGFKEQNFNPEEMLQTAAIFGVKLPPYRSELLQSENWLTEAPIQFSPEEIGEFLIYGIQEKTPPTTNKIPLRIYAATAFGSKHQTTKSCLIALSDLYHQNFQPQKILDMGCGSGILSLAAAKLWQDSTVTSADIDEDAVVVTLQNAKDNRLTSKIHAVQSDGYQNSYITKNAPYDLIFANILARPLIEMSPDLYKNLNKGGYCILSGFLNEQEDWVLGAHRKQGLKLCKIYELDNWRAALMEKE